MLCLPSMARHGDAKREPRKRPRQNLDHVMPRLLAPSRGGKDQTQGRLLVPGSTRLTVPLTKNCIYYICVQQNDTSAWSHPGVMGGADRIMSGDSPFFGGRSSVLSAVLGLSTQFYRLQNKLHSDYMYIQATNLDIAFTGG